MSETKKTNGGKKAQKSVVIYLTDEEKTLLTSDLERANSHRTKNKLSMNELLRMRVFTKIRKAEQEAQPPVLAPIQLPNIEQIIKDCFAKEYPNEGMLTGETAKLTSLIEQIIIENREITVNQVEQIRKDMLDLKDDLLQLKPDYSKPLH